MQKYINLSSSDWSATGRKYIFLETFWIWISSAQQMLWAPWRNLNMDVKYSAINREQFMAFMAHIYNHGSSAHIYNQSTEKGTQPIKMSAALAAVKISSVSGRQTTKTFDGAKPLLTGGTD